MTVDITQEEMNILNLNGITADEVRDNIQYMRGTGLDDDAIRNQYSNTINELRPITKISPDDTAKIKAWQDKGGITPFEYASRKAVEFNGTYDNIDNNANMSKMEDALINSKRNQAVDERIANIEKKKAERNKRVNEGTASFLDRLGAAMDRMGEASYQAQTNPTFNEPALVMAGVDNQGNPLHPDKFDKSKSINFHESLGNSFMAGGWIPFVGGFIEKADDKKQREIQEHILKGEPIRQDELNFLNHRLEEQKEEAIRGYTWGGNVAHDFLPSLVRFGGEIASGSWVLKSLGWSAELAEGASLAEKVAHGVKSMAASGAVNTVLPTSWNDTYANYQGRLLEKGMELTDKGTWIFKESDEKPAISFLKSLGSTFTMFASESSGELLGIPIKGATGIASKYISTPISKYLASNPKLIKFIDNTIPALSKAYEKLNNLPIKGKNIDWLKSAVKYDGFIEELGEEIVEDVMNLTLGTTDEKRTLENYSKAIFKSPDEWAVIAGAVALQGGTLSVASHILGSYMERNGATDEQIIETLNNLTEGEKEQKIQELINENLINVSGYTNEESEKKSQLKNAYFEQIKKTGMEDDEALNNATLMSEAFAALAKNTGMNLDDVTNEANIVIKNMTDEQAQETYEADNSAALNGRVVFNDSQLIENEIDNIFEDYNTLGEDDTEKIQDYIQKMQLLVDIKDGNLTEENTQAAQDLIAEYEQTNPQLAEVLRKASENEQNAANETNGIQEVEFQKIDTAGAENNQTAVAAKEWQKKGTESRFFKKWTDNAPLVNSQEALKYNFKTGEKVAVEGYHGTKRGDRVGEVFRPERATSGPMAYFSSERNISENYATGKEDTSLSDDMRDYDQWFKIKINGRSIPLKDAWWNLTSQKRQEISEKAPHITYDENGENIIYDENNNRGIGNYDYEIKRYRGNALKTLVEGWLNSGSLWGNEDDFLKVLEMVGIDRNDIDYVDPYTDHSKVYDVYLSFKNPLVTTDIPKKVLNKLNREAKKQPIPEMGYGVDAWDKKYRNPLQWVEALNEDYAKDENSYVWTVIPDWVTDVLKGFGYDGIIDMGGKAGGEIHKVYIPFASEQIKSVDNQGTFDESNPNIYYQLIGESGAERLSGEAISGLEEAKELDKRGRLQNIIFEKTGWIKGADKKWRYEISDKDAEILKTKEELKYIEPTSSMTYQEFSDKLDALNDKLSKLVEQKDSKKISEADFEKDYYGTMDERTELIHQYDAAKDSQNANRYLLGEILKHDKLFKAYPKLKYLAVNVVSKIEDLDSLSGVYDGNHIEIVDSAIQSGKFKEILMHEIQHYIQDAEDFNWGGNPESVEKQIRYALNAVEKTETEQKRKDLVSMAREESKDRFVIGAALQTLRIQEKQDTLFKSWWWSEKGTWYVPRKTRKKEYRAFLNEWTQKYLDDMIEVMKERGQLSEYHKFCGMDINEVRKLYRSVDAKINRIWKRTPRDIAYNFRRALDKLEKTEGEYSLKHLKDELYEQLAGEVEARNTVARMNMTDEERRAKSPKFTQEYDDEQQLVVFSDGKTLSYSPASQYDAAKSMNLKEQTQVHFQMNNNQNIKPVHIDINAVPNFESVSDLKEWIEKNLNLLGDIKIKNTNRIVQFSKSNIGRSMKGIKRSPAKRNSYSGLRELVENSVKRPKNEEVDEKHAKRNNGQEIYHNAFEYNGDVYGIEISIDIPKSKKSPYTYAGHKIKIIKNTPAINGTKFPDATGANISINDIRKLFNPDVNNHEDKNLLMTHSAKIGNLDAIIESGSLIAPSMAITNKNQNTLNDFGFGDIIFVRNPETINYNTDNIYDRDIYSPRMPYPTYKTHNGYDTTISDGEYDSMKRQWEKDPARFKELHYGMTFDEYFEGAEKVLFKGYTPSGKRKYVPYNATNIIKEMKEQGLQNGEKWGYGLNSFLSTLAKKQTSLKQLKNTSIELGRVEVEVIQKLKDQYSNFEDDLRQYAKEDYKTYTMFSDVYPEVMNAIATNNKRILNEYMDIQKLEDSDAALYKKVKDFIATAVATNRTYFEAKPMREVPLSEFSTVLVTDEVTEEQKNKLRDLGLEVIDYNGKNANEVLNNATSDVYFQNSNQEMSDDINSNIENARGFTYQRKNFDGTEKENLIVLLNKKADKSTLMHEFAHVYLITLNNLAQHNDRAKELLMTVNKWLHYDGVEYTEFQHERFANNFVAYVKSGKAPSYGLKRVFENFRKWLNDMYSTLQATDDIFITPETEEVFDELLGNISINAQKQEAQEIINKAHNNAIRRYTDDVEQLKRKFKKNQLTEYQKRYRDTALSIVHYALTNSGVPEAKKYRNYNQLQMILLATPEFKKKNKGVSKQQEEIGNILAELDDAFSGTNGFLDEWSEFFSDTGISYDNQEVGADAELATQAFNVLVNHEYAEANPDYYDGQFGELSAQEKAQTEYELEYIIEEYKNADDKTIPLIAYNEWSKKVHPYIEEDIQKEWERQTNEIDRYQALNKFEQAKEDLKLYAAALKGKGDYSAQFAEYARAIVKRLDFMTESDKAKLFDKLKEFNSFRDIERNLDDVMDYAQTLADVSDRKALAEQIDREVRQTIHVWQNGIKKTKYTYPANKLFERLREINKMSSEAVQDMYDAILNEEEKPEYTSDEVHEKEYYSLIEELFIKYKINGVWYNSTEFLQDLLERLQTAKYTAKVARDEIDFERRMKQLNLVDECARAVNKRKDEIQNKPEIKKIGKLNSLGFNFNGALRMIFNDKIKNWASFDYLYAQRDAQVGKDRREFLDKAKKIFGYEGKLANVKLFNRFIDMTQKYYKINQRHSPDIEQGSYRVTQQSPETGYNATQYTQQIRQDIDFAEEWKPIETELSKMEVLYFYIQAKNPTSYAILTDDEKGQFNKYEFDAMLDSLTEQEKMLGDVMQLAAEKYWNGLNAYHIKKYHTELGKVKGYFPRLSEQSEVKMLDMFNDYVNQSSTGKFQKQRTAGVGTRIASANALAVLFDHIEKANTVIIMGEHMDEVNRVFTNPDLKRLIENTWGEDVTREFYGQLAGNLFTAQTLTKSLQEKWYGSIIGNLIKANIFFKPQIGFKQLISFMNYGKGDDYVSAKEWWSKFMKQTLTPSQWKKNIEFMMENDYLRDRFSRGGSMDALKKELDTRYFSKMSLFDEFWGMPVALGDISAIILGGKPYIDVLMEKGYTKDQAFRIFIETTVNDQQSSIPSTLSNMQRNATQSPLAKMAFAYQNTPWQYYRQCTSAIMNAVQSGKKSDIQRAAKMTLLYGWLFPALFNMASSLSLLTAMGGGGDDDLLSDINPLRTITSVLTQHPILGQWVNGILNAAEGKAFNSQDLLTKHISNINKLIRHFKKGEVTLQDLWNSVAAFGETFTGNPLSSMGNAASGVYDVIQGDIMKGTLKVLGYTDFRAKKVTGEK